MSELQKAVTTLRQALNDDEDYFHSWQSNIAMAMYDEFSSHKEDITESERQALLKCCNNGAIRFLNLLIN